MSQMTVDEVKAWLKEMMQTDPQPVIMTQYFLKQLLCCIEFMEGMVEMLTEEKRNKEEDYRESVRKLVELRGVKDE